MDLSIVIPVFNEARKIESDIRLVNDFLDQYKMSGEIIISDDGSNDNTISIVKTIDSSNELKILEQDSHKGKGFAVRQGVLASAGKVVMFVDSGSCVPLKEALQAIDWINSDGCHIVHGTRRHRESNIIKNQKLSRRLTSKIFNSYIKRKFPQLRPFTDTQCGFKIYDGDVARQLYANSHVDGFMFDIEVLLMAITKNYQIKELPVTWTCDPDSRLKMNQCLKRTLSEIDQLR